jgi:hypothetical protein
MATEDPDSSDIAGRPADPFVSARLPNPGDAPLQTLTLSGLLGDSDRERRRRLYFSTRLDYYAEFLTDDVVTVEDIPADQPPFVGLDATRVTLKRDAKIDFVHTRVAAADDFDLDIRLQGMPPSGAAVPAGLTDDPTCGGRRTCFTCPGQGTCQTCDQQTCGGRTCFFGTCGCNDTQATCRTGCGDTCDRQFTCRGTCNTCRRTDCGTCQTDCGQATCETCQTDCGQATCQTCPGQATCRTCATCQTCSPQQTCATCETCAGQATCRTCDTCNPHICWER